MTTPRRRLIRPARINPPDTSQQIQKLRSKLEKERRDLTRWISRLRRAFNAMTKHQRAIARIERLINKSEGE